MLYANWRRFFFHDSALLLLSIPEDETTVEEGEVEEVFAVVDEKVLQLLLLHEEGIEDLGIDEKSLGLAWDKSR